jgi:predicted Zn-dependent peptidase
MAFKGTRKRKAFHILNRLESLGGELNAFTDKEKILFYASLRDEYFERAIELLTDITFESVFPESQIEKERNVILEEMAMYHDDPDDSLQDEFDALVFRGHSLGMNILGSEKTVRSFRRKHFKEFVRAHLDTRRIVFSSVGNIGMERVVALAEKYLGRVPATRTTKRRTKFSGYRPRVVNRVRPIKQARCAMGRPAFSISDNRRSAFYMLTNILGGSGLNSRLNMALREKHGFVYSVGAQYVPFTDTGLFVISFGTEHSQLQRSIQLVKDELARMREEKMGVKQLAAAKEQILGQIAMAEENNMSFMMMMARNLLDLGRVTPLDEIFERVHNCSAETLRQLAEAMFNEERFSYLVMKPGKPEQRNE